MTLQTLAIILAAAFIHAFWNLIVVQSRDRTATTTIVIIFGALLFLPLAILRWNVQAEAWPYIALSSALELVYFALLVAAYQRADLSLVYPVARARPRSSSWRWPWRSPTRRPLLRRSRESGWSQS